MLEHDFDAALNEFEYGDGYTTVETNEAIRFALAFTKKMMGECSETMRRAAYDEWQNKGDAWSQLKAMRDQAIKEIEQ